MTVKTESKTSQRILAALTKAANQVAKKNDCRITVDLRLIGARLIISGSMAGNPAVIGMIQEICNIAGIRYLDTGRFLGQTDDVVWLYHISEAQQPTDSAPADPVQASSNE